MKALFTRRFSGRRAVRAGRFRASGNIGAKAVYHPLTQYRVILQQDAPKAVTQFCEGVILVGFSGIFQDLVFVIVGNRLISFSGANSGKACKIDRGVKVLKDADFGFAGEILQLKFGFESIVGCLNALTFEIQLCGLIQRKLI